MGGIPYLSYYMRTGARLAKAPHYDGVTVDQPLGKAASRIVRTLLDAVDEPAEHVLRGDDTRAVHDMRVAIRRLRSAMKSFEGCFPRKRWRKLRRTTRHVGRKLGTVRDADVHLAVLRAALGAAPAADRAGIAFAIESLVERRRLALDDFALELSRFDRGTISRVLGDA